ncbi:MULTISPECIES: MarR family winged helix-turn-helix transcriptional regulator [Kordiimonas]|mgnify:FL=1|jgi:DNA-binding MarR family transcriptional regulator|uniref:DNA-binding transcriptional regulator, MarR family n=1 Tax=Kordiimonas lacus TaxID=637679 RepID=A0A1G7D9Y7_9PROT|nr:MULTISPECIES: MarR family transcriptional regulator [Kordiimonas]SDE48319.1 DNA-binding transcriptional regulator, MarR family [Kordiimonas lacus]
MQRKLPHSNLYLREEELRRGIELLYFAYRDFTRDPDNILADSSFGRAHHRVLYFVGRNPGTTVSGLLSLLRITKQSLSRVLGQLVEDGYVDQVSGVEDRRQRLLYLTDKGKAFEKELFETQRQRVAEAYKKAGPEAVAGFWEVLLNIVNEEEREAVLRQIEK